MTGQITSQVVVGVIVAASWAVFALAGVILAAHLARRDRRHETELNRRRQIDDQRQQEQARLMADVLEKVGDIVERLIVVETTLHYLFPDARPAGTADRRG